MWLIMRRDLGWSWRPNEWNGHEHMQDKGEGPWRDDVLDKTPWEYFRQVLARFDPDNQYAVTLSVHRLEALNDVLRLTPKASVLSSPTCIVAKGCVPTIDFESAPLTIRAYKWQDDYRVNWSRCFAPDAIESVEHLDIPDDGTM